MTIRGVKSAAIAAVVLGTIVYKVLENMFPEDGFVIARRL